MSARTFPGSAVLFLLLGLALFLLCQRKPITETVPESGVVMALPDQVGNFQGRSVAPSEGELAVLPKDTEIVRKEYANGVGDRIMASIVLSGGAKQSIHRPEVCLPAQGWSVLSAETLAVDPLIGRPFRVMDLRLTREVQVGPEDRRNLEAHYFYWFIGKDMITPLHYIRLFHNSWDRAFRRVNHRWAYAIVMSIVTEGFAPLGKNDAQTVQMLKEFTAEIAPTFMRKETLATGDR
jgi:hypothetical protein